MFFQQFPMPGPADGQPQPGLPHSHFANADTNYTARDIPAHFTVAAQNTTALVFPNVFPVSRGSAARIFLAVRSTFGQSVLDTGVRAAYFRRIHGTS